VRLRFIDCELDFSSETAGDMVPSVLIPAYERITHGFPEERNLVVEVENPDRLKRHPIGILFISFHH
jgi:hypothetical protein